MTRIGKTKEQANIVHAVVINGQKVLVATDKTELPTAYSEVFKESGTDVSVVKVDSGFTIELSNK